MTTYRTKIQGTDRILKDWILKERLAFNLETSLTVSDLSAMLPNRCKEQLGDFKPTDNVFRKMSSGFNNVSDIWIELMRFIGVWDFSAEQAILGTVSTFLDKENVRVKLNEAYKDASRSNSIEVLCLNEPSYQGLIRYEGDRLSFPPSIFDAFVERRLNVYNLNCEYLSDVLLIPGVSDPKSLLIAEMKGSIDGATKEEDLSESAETLPQFLTDELDDSEESEESPELEAERNAEAATDARLEQMAEDLEESDDAIALTPEMSAAEEDKQAARMADIYSGSDEILDF